MRRWLTGIIILLGFLLIAVFSAPILFKNKLADAVINVASRQLNTEVNVSSVSLSLLKNFPQLSLELKDLLVPGSTPFENDTLLYVKSVRTKAPLKTLLSPSDIVEGEITIDGLQFLPKLDVDGRRNWNFKKEEAGASKSEVKNDSDESTRISGNLNLMNALVVYQEAASGVEFRLKDINLELSENPEGDKTFITLNSNVGDLEVRLKEIAYLNDAMLALDAVLEADRSRKTYRVAENHILINQLPLQLKGSVFESDGNTACDLTLLGEETEFGKLLELFPFKLQVEEKKLAAIGAVSVSGSVKGVFKEADFPEMQLTVELGNGILQYEGMPEAIQNVSANLSLYKPQGAMDSMQVSISNARAEVAGDPIDFALKIEYPFSDPHFDGKLDGKIDLGNWRKVWPLNRANLTGELTANILVNGKYSDIEAENYSAIVSDGLISLKRLQYSSPKLTQRILVSEGSVELMPQKIRLNSLAVYIGASDFRMSGEVDDYLSYYFNKGVLKADLDLRSNFVNLNQLFLLEAKSSEQRNPVVVQTSLNDEEEKIAAFDIPDRVNLSFKTNIQNAILGRIPVRNISGLVQTKNSELVLQNLDMLLFDGSLRMNGSYQNNEQNQPDFDYAFDIHNFDIPTMAETLGSFREMLPGAERSTGRLDASVDLNGQFDQQLNVIRETTSGKGSFSTRNLVIVNSPVFRQLGGIIRREKLQRVDVSDFTAHLNVENGNVDLPEFETKVMGQETKVKGTMDAQNNMDARLDFVIERDAIGPDIEKILAVIPGNQKIKELPAGVNISGPADKLKVSPDLAKTTKAVADATKDDLKNLGRSIFKLFK